MPLWIYFHGEIISKAISCDRFRIGVIIFGSVWFLSKKITKPKFFFFEKKTETEPKPGQTDRFRFGLVFWAKTSSNRFGSVLARFFRFGSVFFRFFIGFGSVWFFRFFAYKTEPAGFFKNLIGLIGFFFGYFFSGFLGLIGFLVFLLTPSLGGRLGCNIFIQNASLVMILCIIFYFQKKKKTSTIFH
jgi:hypothetical protein